VTDAAVSSGGLTLADPPRHQIPAMRHDGGVRSAR
jgi:hypothetical protein